MLLAYSFKIFEVTCNKITSICLNSKTIHTCQICAVDFAMSVDTNRMEIHWKSYCVDSPLDHSLNL